MNVLGIILVILLAACGRETPSPKVNNLVVKKDAPQKRPMKNATQDNKVETSARLKDKKDSIKTEGLGEKKKNLTDFLPKGFLIFKTINGDLNKDGLDDAIIIIKGTDKSKIVKNENGKLVDRNRRGILVLFQNKDHYELAAKNHDCFSSENEDGGPYMPPELSVLIKKGKLYLDYSHGRYGGWQYTFRHKNAVFELIGFDRWVSSGPILDRDTSVNFLTKKKLVRTNTNQNTKESGDEIFDEKWKDLKIGNLFKLSEIKDFDSLDLKIN